MCIGIGGSANEGEGISRSAKVCKVTQSKFKCLKVLSSISKYHQTFQSSFGGMLLSLESQRDVQTHTKIFRKHCGASEMLLRVIRHL
jgi:hypothetical protein